MVNTGLPSKACETCRRRRVKCDLRRPGCLRCEKIGQPCSGYRNLNSQTLVFRVNTPSSYSNTRSRNSSPRANVEGAEERDAKRDTRLGEVTCHGSRKVSPQFEFGVSPSHPIAEPWDTHVMPLLVTRFSYAEPGGYRVYGLLECLPRLIQEVEPGSVLHIACYAVGYAYLTNTKRTFSLALSHRRAYGQALNALRKAITDPILQKQDAILLAVWLLCLYELILGTPVSDKSEPGPMNWKVHSNALENLLRLRGTKQFATETGVQLFQLAYHTVQINALQLGLQPPKGSQEWFEAIQSSTNVDKTVLVPMLLFCDAATRICNTARHIIQKGSPEKLLATLRDTVLAYHNLEESLKDEFANLIASSSSSPIGLQSFIELRTRNHIDACFLRLDYCILELLFHAGQIPNLSTTQLQEHTQQRQITIIQSRARADRILASLPRFLATPGISPSGALGSLADILRLMWPLRLISNSPIVHEAQRNASKAALSRIGYEEGIMQAVGTYNRPAAPSESP